MKKQTSRTDTRRIAVSGLLIALMLVLGFIESRLPINIGVPGIKLGLSNSVLIFAVYMMDFPSAYCLMLLKVVLSGLLFSGVSGMMYALAGGLLSLTAMCILSRIKGMPILLVSIFGGLLHNVGQVLLAMVVLHTPQLAYYMLILALAGIVCGALTGLCAGSVLKHLKVLGWKGLPGENAQSRPAAVIALAVLLLAVAVFLGIRSIL